MEFSIGSNDVFLALHPTYCAEDDGTMLAAVSKYKPLVDWLTKYQTEGFKLSRVIVRNVQWVAKRISVLAADVELVSTERGVSSSSNKLIQSVTFTDDAQAILLPVLSVNGFSYAVVVRQRRVALGGDVSEEAITGTVTKEGFTGLGANVLAKFGFKLNGSDLVALRTTPFSFGEGLLPQSIVKTSHALTQVDAQPLLDGVALEVDGSSGAVIIARLLDDVARTATDLKLLTAASLARV